MLIKKISSTKGLTLIELLIAMALNLVLLLALTSMFSSTVGHYNTVNKSDLLSQQLQSAMQMMANDIRRAGYWVNSSNDIGTGANSNPFMTASTDITVNANNNCVLFTYDYSKNGTLPTIASGSDDERYGFRLLNNAIQARPPGASYSCSASANAWENITNTNIITISSLIFTLNTTTVPIGATSKSMLIRTLDISITGQLASDATITKTLTEHIRIRNDKYVP